MGQPKNSSHDRPYERSRPLIFTINEEVNTKAMNGFLVEALMMSTDAKVKVSWLIIVSAGW